MNIPPLADTNHRNPQLARSARFLLLMILTCLSAITAACDGPASSTNNQSSNYTIVTTTAMIADIARNVAGERADVASLMGPGVDPHLYLPTRSDMSRLLAADVFLYHGLSLEGRMTDTFKQVAEAGRPVHAVAERIDEHYILKTFGQPDPHIWMDVRGWIMVTHVVIDILCEFDPDHAHTYRANGQAYIDQLTRLDDYVQQAIATIPEKQRVLVTAHDAFAYFGRAYGVQVKAIQGISTNSEAGLQHIKAISDLVVSRQIPAVFTETSVPDRNIKALIEGAQAAGHAVALGGELFSDAMGQDGTYHGTYIGMIDHNATTIVRALEGRADGFANRAQPSQAASASASTASP